MRFNKSNLEYRQKCDKIKKDFALNNGFNFLEIPYWENKNMINIIGETIADIKKSIKR